MLITHQCFSCCRALLTQSQGLFSFLCSPASKGAGVHWELGGDRTRTDGSVWPKGYSIPCIMLNNKTGGIGQRGCHCSGTGWVGIGWWVVRNCIVHHLLCTYYYYYLSSISVLLNCILTHKLLLFYPLSCLPCPTGVEGKWTSVWCLTAFWVKAQHPSTRSENPSAEFISRCMLWTLKNKIQWKHTQLSWEIIFLSEGGSSESVLALLFLPVWLYLWEMQHNF